MSGRLPTGVASALLCMLMASCAMGPPPGSPETGYAIHGYVGNSASEPAAGETVHVVDDETGEVLSSARTSWSGAYSVAQLRPGRYLLRVGEVEVPVELGPGNQRVDIDLSAAGGRMSYAAHHATEAVKGAGPKGPPSNDPALVRALAGRYWGYSSGVGGGTEWRLGFCSDGSYHEYSESGYSGGDESGSWSTLGGGGATGAWTVVGTPQQGTISVTYNDESSYEIPYQAGEEAGCFWFDGAQLCRTEGC